METRQAGRSLGSFECHSKLQWSHGVAAVETRSRITACDASCSFDALQWSHDVPAVETHGNSGPSIDTALTQPDFNGATTLSPLKRTDARGTSSGLSNDGVTSMEPRRYRRGNGYPHAPAKIVGSQNNFNGATTLSPWKRGILFATRGRVLFNKSFNGATTLSPVETASFDAYKPGSNHIGFTEPRPLAVERAFGAPE